MTERRALLSAAALGTAAFLARPAAAQTAPASRPAGAALPVNNPGASGRWRPPQRLGLGCQPLSNGFGKVVSPATAIATVESAWDSGMRLFDTSPWYGLGRSESILRLRGLVGSDSTLLVEQRGTGMAAPLSQDLRRRLLRAVEAGSSAREAARRFAVSESAAIKLVRRVRETGSTAPARMGGYRTPLLAGHEELLRELVAAKGHITLAEIKARLAERGIEAGCLTTIWSTLRRLGLSHKKTA